jgi:thiol-disulfide isomerase/thioredoxin
MKIRKITLSDVFTILLVMFTIAVLLSARVKSWIIMGLMAIGFYNPQIPVIKPGEKLMPAPAIVMQNTQGTITSLDQHRGKVVFINFWATWCPPCLAELPSVNNLYLRVKNNPNIVFMTVDVDNNLPKSSQFLKDRGYQLPVYSANLNGLPTDFYSGTIPTTVVINKRGLVVFNHANKASYDDPKFADFITKLSKE